MYCFFTVLSPFTAGGSLFLTGIGSSIVVGSSVTSFVDLFSGNNQELIHDAAENSRKIKKDINFLEELMTIYMASTNEAWRTFTEDQKMMRYLSFICNKDGDLKSTQN